jgi:hypothetical protein
VIWPTAEQQLADDLAASEAERRRLEAKLEERDTAALKMVDRILAAVDTYVESQRR